MKVTLTAKAYRRSGPPSIGATPKNGPAGAPPLPKNYRLVHEIVAEGGAGCHLAPSDIYMKALERQPGIGLSTIYRALERLRDLGLISELCVPGADSATYEPAGPQHAHFRCSVCGRVEDVAYVIPAATLKTLARQHGISIEGERVTFDGRCAACARD